MTLLARGAPYLTQRHTDTDYEKKKNEKALQPDEKKERKKKTWPTIEVVHVSSELPRFWELETSPKKKTDLLGEK